VFLKSLFFPLFFKIHPYTLSVFFMNEFLLLMGWFFIQSDFSFLLKEMHSVVFSFMGKSFIMGGEIVNLW